MSNKIIQFYELEYTPDNGFSAYDIMKWDPDNRNWEDCHDYIQWIFPTKTKSAYNPDAPVLTDEDIEEFKSDDMKHLWLIKFYTQFLNFLMFFLFDPDLQGYSYSYDYWCEKGNHNLLRITRVLESLTLLGAKGTAQDFLTFLEKRYEEYPDELTEAIVYWRKAIEVQ
jgi:hypothetical protein